MRRHGQPAAVLVGLSFSESAKAANFAVYAAASDSRAPMLFKAPMLAAWTWAGPYLGGTIGYSAGKSRTDTIFGDPASGAGLFATTASRDLDGAIGGAQAGYNWLAGMWLAGIEGDLNYSGQRAKLTASVIINTIVGSHNTKAGWTLGGGLEGRLAGNWTAKIEYLYLDLGTVTTIPAPAPNSTTAVAFNSRVTDSVLRVGVNYKFDSNEIRADY
jgi:opacity protein-like surface antigen